MSILASVLEESLFINPTLQKNKFINHDIKSPIFDFNFKTYPSNSSAFSSLNKNDLELKSDTNLLSQITLKSSANIFNFEKS